jgi:thymidylate synthase
MRFYETFPIALNEIQREIKEMGIAVHTQSVQNMNIEGNRDYDALEITNYQYMVSRPNYNEIPVKSLVWCEDEFAERISGEMLNPGEAWKHRRSYWEKFLNKWGRFDYAYPQRMALNLDHVINALRKDNFTRRAFLPILGLEDHSDDFNRRFPCSLGYHFLYRQGRLNMTYLLRSSDYFEHLMNDLWLAHRLQCHVAQETGLTAGTFCHWVGSLHAFAKDVKGVF